MKEEKNNRNDIYCKIFKAFCDNKRLEIIQLLTQGERCACVLMEETGIAQSALSYHMKILCDSGIVRSKQEGKWTHYSINKENAKNASELLLEITNIK